MCLFAHYLDIRNGPKRPEKNPDHWYNFSPNLKGFSQWSKIATPRDRSTLSVLHCTVEPLIRHTSLKA
jgi:hypothetical protein